MKTCSSLLIGIILYTFNAQARQLAPAAPNLTTPWTELASAGRTWTEYPRPQLVRSNWVNLNGIWDYAIVDITKQLPISFPGKIRVPFPVESMLSGVQMPLRPDQRLWYRRTFEAPSLKGGKKLLLHFGAADQQATVYINGQQAGTHLGGYDPFSLDITRFLNAGVNELVVSIVDSTDLGSNPHGKQTLNPRRIFYTAVSGIWQTVWLEAVPKIAISSLVLNPDIDNSKLSLAVKIDGAQNDIVVKAVARTNGSVISEIIFNAGQQAELRVPDMILWSPDHPFLYDLSVKIFKAGKLIDSVSSYFGMRKVDIRKDSMGIERIFLNNGYTFNLGVLDQGYWPDGLYTAPSSPALKFDVETIKAMGFNTIRKHIKIEPDRWYYYCDSLGMLVWQDMPCWFQKRLMPASAGKNFELEAGRHVAGLYNHPSIIMWVLFNEDWGSYDQQRLAGWMKSLDTTRILNANSGSFINNHKGSDLTDLHNYPDPTLPPYEPRKALVCGEFGGTYAPVAGHEWLAGEGFGHSSPPGFTLGQRYEHMIAHLRILEKEGLSGSIFTEPFDVEREENGLMTYDREVYKIPLKQLRQWNLTVYPQP